MGVVAIWMGLNVAGAIPGRTGLSTAAERLKPCVWTTWQCTIGANSHHIKIRISM